MRRGLAAVIAIATLAGCAARDRKRTVHAGATAVGAVTYVAIEVAFKDDLVAEPCRWCEPTGLDRAARDAIRWDDTHLADQLSDATAFYLAPLTSLGLLGVATRPDRDVRRFIDDALPVVETAVIAALLHHAVKFTVGRQRPLAHFGEAGRPPDLDDNVSFYSGHTQVAFATVTAAGTVARLRDHAVEPWIWGIGLPLAAATGYLRMAGDKHYLIDVTTGALIGSAAGLLLPRVLMMDRETVVVPAPGGAALVGSF